MITYMLAGKSNCGEVPKVRFPFWLNLWNTINLGTVMLWAFLFFGTLPEVFLWWHALYLLIR